MPRKPKTIPGPSRLSKILESLTKSPRPYMSNLKALKVTLAVRNDHFGARHFLKNDLPRIRYANPALEIEVNKKAKTPADHWKPEMTLEFRDGSTQTLNLDKKWSSTIFEEVMDLAGGSPWERWKRERKAAGLPVVDVPEPKVKTASPKADKPKVDYSSLFNTGKTGAAAVLP